VTDGILWLASYPKSGNTWLRAVLTAWRTGLPPRLDALTAHSIAARPPFDAAVGIPSTYLTPDEVAILRPRVAERLVAEGERPLVRKVHDGLYPGPGGEPVVPAAATRAAIYMLRDPRDVAVSLAHHSARPVEWAVERLADPGYTLGSGRTPAPQLDQRLGTWTQHVTSWIEGAQFPVHVVRYEDCIEDPVRAFGAALRFSGLGDVSDEDVSRAVESAAFERLRGAENEHGFSERVAPGRRFFRSGRAGGWRDEMSPEAAARIEAAHGNAMARFGYA
jgi:aryl sulfotransferase